MYLISTNQVSSARLEGRELNHVITVDLPYHRDSNSGLQITGLAC